MCHRCDYAGLLQSGDLDYTAKRFRVLEIVGNSSYPLTAQEIHETLSRTEEVNRVTVYRILDLLVESKLVDRISSGDRTFRYGLAPNKHHRPHPHFYCTRCSNMECLSPVSIPMSMESLERTFPGLIEKVEVRLDGVCKNCLKLHQD
jgi:Fur family ferric uptake transcriptional regulator